MKLRRILKALVTMIYLGFFALCCFSGPVTEEGEPAPAVIGPKLISFAAGSFPEETTALSVVLQSGETAKLSGFTGLLSADFSGSQCYEEIEAWAEEHPEVSVRYTVALPDGQTLDNSAESVSLSGLDSQGLARAAELLRYLPRLKTVELSAGDEGAAPAPGDIKLLRESLPEAELSCSFSLMGRPVSLADESLDLTGLLHEDVASTAEYLACMPNLKYVELGTEGSGTFSWEDIGVLQTACPNTDFNFKFTLLGQSLSLMDETVSFSHIPMEDEGAAVRSILPYMKKCTYLDMDSCGVSNGAMEAIRNDFPGIKVVWRIWFGEAYSVRTDVERILASKPSKGGVVTDEDVQVLRYCTDLKYLDIGHNECITDLSFAYGTPNLEVLVAAMNPMTDLTPLASCPKLEYIELNSTGVGDLSPLGGLTELRHLNIANCENVTDISPLYGLTELERLWIGCITPVPAEQVAEMQAAAPNCEIDTQVYDPTSGRWRVIGYTELSLALYDETGWLQEVLHPRYELLREQFGYSLADYAFYWNDPLY